jgi:manganese transport protein
MSLKKRIINILFWSIISAAFIGPGTITTASKAGAIFQFDLLWALLFSTFACLLLQEACARISIFSGLNLGEAIARQFEGKSSRILVLVLVAGAIILGSAAYETGNLLGAVAGISLIFRWPPYLFVLIIGCLAALALSIPSLKIIAKLMGYIVVIMGFSFLSTAFFLKPEFGRILHGSFVPSLPAEPGAGILVLGLIGTTVVPYNLFLGSELADKKQKIAEIRFGLSVAIFLGGIISMAVLVVGTAVTGDFTFDKLVNTLSLNLGTWAVYIFGIGMFAAGFSSAITAPLASAITVRSLFGKPGARAWENTAIRFRLVWGLVLITGIVLGMTNVEPIPAIILAQALNGLVLPLICIFLLFVINDPLLVGEKNCNGWFSNILMGLVVGVTIVLGLISILKAVQSLFNINLIERKLVFNITGLITIFFSAYIFRKVFIVRKSLTNRK